MHASDIDKYEGPPCEMCRVSQFVGTCAHRKRKVQVERWTKEELELLHREAEKLAKDLNLPKPPSN